MKSAPAALTMCFLFLATFNCLAQDLTGFSTNVDGKRKYGFKDANGKIVVSPKYDGIAVVEDEYFSEGRAAVKLNEKWGFVDNSGREITALKYDAVSPFHNGFAVVTAGKFPNTMDGLVNKSGKEVIPVKYKAIRNSIADQNEAIVEGMVIFKSDNLLYGFADTNGVEIVAPKYQGVLKFSNGMAAVQQNNKWGFIDKSGKEIIPFKYDKTNLFSDGFCAVNIGGTGEGFQFKGGNWGFIDRTGKELTTINYYWVWPFSEGLAFVLAKENGLINLLDISGKETALKYNNVTGGFAEGIAILGKVNRVNYDESTYHVIDKSGKEVFMLDKKMAFGHEHYSEGLIAVLGEDGDEGGYGYMDKSGKIVIPFKYESAEPFRNGKAKVAYDGEFFYIDKSGKELNQ